MATPANQAAPALPTHDEFLAGLVSVLPGEDGECRICMEDSDNDPVRLPCHHTHVFCRACILRWFQEKNTCPVCRTAKLFRRLSRRELLFERATDILERRGDLLTMEFFGVGTFQRTPEDMEELSRGNRHAAWWILHGFHRSGQARLHGQVYRIRGTGRINTARLRADFAVLGNLIPAISEALNHPYTLQHTQDWTLVLTTLWKILQQYDGKTLRISSWKLLNKIRKALMDHPEFRYIQHIFLRPRDPESFHLTGDLLIFLDFIGHVALQEQSRHERETWEANKNTKRARIMAWLGRQHFGRYGWL